ncbi:MAG: AMP-binding protein, partial [Chromatiales bacterium]|nr:AMP-binding protein [Chromatiales bacterium]
MSVSKYTPPATVFAAGHANVGSLFHAAAAARPEHTAIVDGERTLTYSQLEARSNQLANAFVALELERHDRVAILASNCAEYFEVELA